MYHQAIDPRSPWRYQNSRYWTHFYKMASSVHITHPSHVHSKIGSLRQGLVMEHRLASNSRQFSYSRLLRRWEYRWTIWVCCHVWLVVTGSFYYLFLYVLCGTCTRVSVHVCVCVRVHGGLSRNLTVFSTDLHCVTLRQGHRVRSLLFELGWPGNEFWRFACPHSPCNHTPPFLCGWVLGVQIQVFMLVEQTLLTH